MNILAIETATDVLSLALATGGGEDARVHETTRAAGQRQAELILGEIDALLARAGLSVRDLGAVAYGAGPGSFTGLRIACGVAQGIAAARGIPVLGVSTLAAIAEASGAARTIACLDARMGEVYHAAFEKRNGALHEVIPAGLRRPGSVPLPAGDDPADGDGVPASIHAFFEREVRPHVPDAWIDTAKRDPKDGRVGLIGYEINFNRYFYRYTPPRPLEEIEADIKAIEGDIVRMLAVVAGGAIMGVIDAAINTVIKESTGSLTAKEVVHLLPEVAFAGMPGELIGTLTLLALCAFVVIYSRRAKPVRE